MSMTTVTCLGTLMRLTGQQAVKAVCWAKQRESSRYRADLPGSSPGQLDLPNDQIYHSLTPPMQSDQLMFTADNANTADH